MQFLYCPQTSISAIHQRNLIPRSRIDCEIHWSHLEFGHAKRITCFFAKSLRDLLVFAWPRETLLAKPPAIVTDAFAAL
jgi:hypothetical protein